MIDARHYEDTYSNDDVAGLCEIGGFDPDDIVKFRQELEDIAVVYRCESSKYVDLPRSSDVARDLKGLIKRITRLNDGLKILPDEAAE